MHLVSSNIETPVVEFSDGTRVERLLTPRQLATALGVHVDSVRRWRRTGEISRSSFEVLGPGTYRYSMQGVLTDLRSR